jgi:hypothetical protein
VDDSCAVCATRAMDASLTGFINHSIRSISRCEPPIVKSAKSAPSRTMSTAGLRRAGWILTAGGTGDKRWGSGGEGVDVDYPLVGSVARTTGKLIQEPAGYRPQITRDLVWISPRSSHGVTVLVRSWSEACGGLSAMPSATGRSKT